MIALRVHVHGMDCADEAALLRRALATQPAITRIEFDLIHGFVDLAFDPQRISEVEILDAIRSTNLDAHAVHGEADQQRVVDEHAGHRHSRTATLAMAGSGLLFLIGWAIEGVQSEHWIDIFVHDDHARHSGAASWTYAASALVGLWPMWPRALAAIRHLRLDMHVLVCVTVIGAAGIGEWSEGAAVAFLFGFAHWLEAWSLARARREIAALVGRGPAMVADRSGRSAGNMTSTHAAAWGGGDGATERWIERFAGIYTPAVTLAAVVVAMLPPLVDGEWAVWFYRALLFLVLACPCALVISTPVTFVAALSAAARQGVLVRGAAILERAASATSSTHQGLSEVGINVVRASSSLPADQADVVLSAPDERAIVVLVAHARRAMRVVRQNVIIALGTKVAFLIAAPFGAVPLWLAVLADTGATVLVTLNGLRLLKTIRTN